MFSFAHSTTDEMAFTGVLEKRIRRMPVARLTGEIIGEV